VTEAIVGLASKCLIMTTFDSKIREYFLLETTREYALRKLCESDEADDVLARKANFLGPLCERSHGHGFGDGTLGNEPVLASVASR
jgi:predicted ATPase